MRTSERHRRIVAHLEKSDFAAVTELAEELGASEATLRRDLAELDSQGLLHRVHGGARRMQVRGFGAQFSARASTNTEGKRRIARAVAGMLVPGEAVVLDSGTTALEVARVITDQPLRVVPLSLPSLEATAGSTSLTVTIPGGELRRDERSFTGPLTQRTLADLRFDTALIAPCAVSLESGATAYDTEDAAIKHAAMRSAERRILLCDSTKWGRTAFAAIAGLEAFDVLVTDRSLSREELGHLTDAAVDVVTA